MKMWQCAQKTAAVCCKFATDCRPEEGKSAWPKGKSELLQKRSTFYFCSSSWYFFRLRTKVELSMPRLAAAARTF